MTDGMRWRGVKCPSCGCTGTTPSCPKQCTCGFGVAWEDINGPESILVTDIKVPSDYRFWSAEYRTPFCGCTTEFDPSDPLAAGLPINLTKHFKSDTKNLGSFVLSRETTPVSPSPCLYSLDVSGFPLAATKDDLWGTDGLMAGAVTNLFSTVYPIVTITTAGKFPLGVDWGNTHGQGRYFSGLRRIEFIGETSVNPNYCARLILYPQDVWTPLSSRRWESQNGYCSNAFTVPCWATDNTDTGSGCSPIGDGVVPTDERYWEVDGFQVDSWDSANLNQVPSLTIFIPHPNNGPNPFSPNLGQNVAQFHTVHETVYMNEGTIFEDVSCDDFVTTETADATRTTNYSNYTVEANIETKYGSYCECWSNLDGEGCLPFPQNDTQPEASDYVSGLVLTAGGTTYSQISASSVSGMTIVVPTDNGDVILSQDSGNGAGRKVRIQTPTIVSQTFDLDSCVNTINGTSGSDTLVMTWLFGEDCTACPDELVTGCCQYADGTVSKVSGAANCTGTYSGDNTECPPVGCCFLAGFLNESGVTQAWCNGVGGTWTQGASCDGTGWCIDNTTGAITAGVEQNDCTGTWSATEPVSGCCTISGTQHPNVAQSWCTGQSGTFVAGDCPAVSTDWTSEPARVTIQSLSAYCDDPDFNCFEDAGLPTYNWTGISSNPCVGATTRIASLTGTVTDYESTNLNVTAQQLTVQFGTTNTVITLSLTFDGGQTVQGQVILPTPTGNCPSISWSGALTNWSGTWSQTCSGTTFTPADWVCTLSASLECCTP